MLIRPANSKPSSLPRSVSLLLLAACSVFVSAAPLEAQTNSTSTPPYASINRDAVSYAGPGRDVAHDLGGAEIKIGILAPLQGPRKPEGDALLQAAQLALEDEAANPLPHGRRLALVPRDESGPWGRASSEVVRLVVEDHAVALITSADGGAAHLAEQVGNKIGVPVITLSTDSTTTQINLPWIFRLGASDTAQAQLFAQHIYAQEGFRKVLLVVERNHDGRVGGEEFEKAVRELDAPQPVRYQADITRLDAESAAASITAQNPEAVVVWTGPETSAKLVTGLRQAKSPAAIYLCRKAAQEPFVQLVAASCRSCRTSVTPLGTPHATDAKAQRKNQETGSVWVVVSRSNEPSASRESFEQRYLARTGKPPSVAAAEAYDAVRLVAAAVRQAGPNRARLRDSLAGVSDFLGVCGIISFDGAGNNRAEVALAPFE